MTLRSDSTLAQLTDDQQAQVFDWLQDFGYTETIKRLALPPPDGFGIKTYRASLHAFFVRYAAQLKVEHAASAAALAAGSTSTPAFISVSEDALHHSALLCKPLQKGRPLQCALHHIDNELTASFEQNLPA